jgi:hypothetical protein
MLFGNELFEWTMFHQQLLHIHPGANPAIASYNASAVKIYSATM